MKIRVLWLLSLVLLVACQPPLLRDDGDPAMKQVSRGPSPADTWVQLAVEYYRLGDYPVALKKAGKAIEKDPANANAHLILGLVYEALGEGEQARRAYGRAKELAPEDPYVLNAWGQLQCKDKNYDAALAAFEKALENPLYDAPWVALSNAGLCALAAGRRETARDYLLRALQKNPRFPPALAAMADLSYQQGRYLSTRAYVQRYREVATPTPRLLYLSVLAERQLGNARQAERDARLLQAEFPDSIEAHQLAQ